MKKLFVIAATLLAGCAQLAPSVVPQLTLEFCDEVQYVRKGLDATIVAKCKVPVR